MIFFVKCNKKELRVVYRMGTAHDLTQIQKQLKEFYILEHPMIFCSNVRGFTNVVNEFTNNTDNVKTIVERNINQVRNKIKTIAGFRQKVSSQIV